MWKIGKLSLLLLMMKIFEIYKYIFNELCFEVKPLNPRMLTNCSEYMMSQSWWCHQTMPPLSLRALSFVVFYIPLTYCRWNESIIMYICNSINYRQYINVIWIYPFELWKKQSLYDYRPKTKWFPTSISWSQLLREINILLLFLCNRYVKNHISVCICL